MNRPGPPRLSAKPVSGSAVGVGVRVSAPPAMTTDVAVRVSPPPMRVGVKVAPMPPPVPGVVADTVTFACAMAVPVLSTAVATCPPRRVGVRLGVGLGPEVLVFVKVAEGCCTSGPPITGHQIADH